MLESFVSVLPCDWITLSGCLGGPGFSSCSVKTRHNTSFAYHCVLAVLKEP